MNTPMPFDVKLMNMTAAVLLLVFALMALGTLFNWAWRNPAFAVRGIVVTGEVTHNNAITLQANVTPHLRGTFFTLDLAQARAVFEAVPWVRKAVVHRDFPNRLKVVLQEHRAMAYWGPEGETRLLNSYGEVFDANVGEVEQDELPRLDGPQGQEGFVLAMYQTLKLSFSNMDMALSTLELSPRGGWRAVLDSGAQIELGSGSAEDVMARVAQFLRTLTQVTARYGRNVDALETADLRHTQGYAIRLRGVSTGEAPVVVATPPAQH